jgi:inosine-uridine nucleoside N-ribohydrolase
MGTVSTFPPKATVLIDTDCGVDDALALILALRSPELDVRTIVTVAGNVEVALCTRNVLRVLAVLKPDSVPVVAQGSARPLRRPLFTAKEVHGDDGLGDVLPRRPPPGLSTVRANGTRAIIDFCRRWEKQGTIVAVGPLTNVARAWMRSPSVVSRIGRIVSMGGAFHIPGNTGPVAEFNYYVDPEAAQAVIASGLSLDIIPLDITHQVPLLRSDLERRAQATPGPLSTFVRDVTKSYMLYHEATEGFNGGYLHDPVAVAAAADASLFEFAEAQVAVEKEGLLTRGMTVRFAEGTALPPGMKRVGAGSVRIATRLDRERFLALFHERMWG